MTAISRCLPRGDRYSEFSRAPVDWNSCVSSSGYQSLYFKNRRDFDQLELRIESFLLFPAWSHPNREALAKANFHFTGDHDTTKCHCCNLEVSDWKQSDIPAEIHRRRSPNCQFVKNFLVSSKQQLRPSDSDSSDEEDCVDGAHGCEQSSDSDDSDVEIDGPTDAAYSRPKTSVTHTCKSSTTSSEVTSYNVCSSAKSVASPIDKAALKCENERMRSSLTCRVCKTEQVQTLFLPCRHLITCEVCAEKMDDCMLCTKKILGTVRTFLL